MEALSISLSQSGSPIAFLAAPLPVPEASTSSSHPYIRDEQFYFNFIIFLVEGRLFKVPRHKFESESVIFRSMFELPPGADNTPDGLSDDQPLRLDEIEQLDFRHLLKYLYPRDIDRPVNLTLDEWLSVLKLASLWDMERVRNDAIDNLAKLISNPAQKVGIAMDYEIEPWILPALNELVQRADPITSADLAFIGIECALKVAAIRECCQRSHTNCYYCSPGDSQMSVQPTRGLVTVDTKERIKIDFQDLLFTPSLRCDKEVTAREMTAPRKPKKKGKKINDMRA